MTSDQPARSDRGAVAYPAVWRANLTLAILVAAYICSYLDRQILALLVQPIRADLQISDLQISLLQGLAFAIFFSFAGLPMGWLADRYHRLSIVAAGVFLWSMMTICCGLANSFSMLFLARVGLGIGEAALAPAAYSLLSDSFRPERLVRVVSMMTLGAMIGQSLTLGFGGLLVDYLSRTPPPLQIGGLAPWQMTFVLAAVPAILLCPIILLLKEPARRGATSGKAVSVSGTLAYLWGRRGDYAPLYLCMTLLGVVNYGGLAWLPTHLIRTFEVSASHAGILLGSLQLVSSLLGIAAGTLLTEHFQRRGRADAHMRATAFVSGGAMIGLIGLLMPTLETTLAMWAISIFSLGAYGGIIVAALQLITPNSMRATNSALLLMVHTLGGMALGNAVIGFVSDIVFPAVPRGIGYALVIVGLPVTALSLIIAVRRMAHFGAVVREATWQPTLESSNAK